MLIASTSEAFSASSAASGATARRFARLGVTQHGVQPLLLRHGPFERGELILLERQLQQLVGHLAKARVHAAQVGIARPGSSSSARRSSEPMRLTSVRLARAACEALNTAVRRCSASCSLCQAE